MEGTSICGVLLRLIDSPNTDVQANCAAALGSLSSSCKGFFLFSSLSSRCFILSFSAALFTKQFVTHWEKVSAYFLNFFASKDPTLIHIALWTMSQLSHFSGLPCLYFHLCSAPLHLASFSPHFRTPDINSDLQSPGRECEGSQGTERECRHHQACGRAHCQRL